jgi:hypothetical protein
VFGKYAHLHLAVSKNMSVLLRSEMKISFVVLK